ncbi:hypothetical protein NB231_01254 [Nitrococcus mobilis Nb-231]|uniref:Uncharacterized protein n=1 Tax=Nitrococcus mobilis Nb-231 TaxID=314278 RepID=A4BS16_9GAMM|nr:hypothetical protein NB231_01254 [Nitrococcus mobilis Nb-231]
MRQKIVRQDYGPDIDDDQSSADHVGWFAAE